jgi:hypothetical protein
MAAPQGSKEAFSLGGAGAPGIGQTGEPDAQMGEARRVGCGVRADELAGWRAPGLVAGEKSATLAWQAQIPGGTAVTHPSNPDGDETRAGYRSGEGVDSVLRHLMAAARRLQRRKNEVPDSRGPSHESDEGDGDGDGSIDVKLPP